MNRAILTCFSENMRGVADLTIPTHMRLAEALGAEYVARPVEKETCAWDKITMVGEALETHDQVMWIDADAAVTSTELRGRAWLTTPPSPAVLFTSDINGLNAGVFMATAGLQTREFFWTVGHYGKKIFDGQPDCDQQALRHFSLEPRYAGLVQYLPQTEMNSYWPGAYDYPGAELAHWKPGHLILHLPGLSDERRIEILRSAL
jgi:hypothetical protein